MATVVNLTGGMSFFSQQLLLPLVSVYAEDLGLSTVAIGVLMAANSVVPAIGAMSVGRWSDRFGHRRVLLLGAFGVLLSTGLYAIANGFTVLLIAQLISGYGRMLTWVSAQTAITQVAEGEARERMVAAFTVYTAIGMAAGPLAGGLLKDRFGDLAAFLGFGVTGILQVLLALATPAALGRGEMSGPKMDRTPEAGGGPDGDSGTALGIARLPGVQVALGFSFVSLFALGARQSFFPVYMDRLGYSSTLIGALLTVASLGATAVRPLTPYLLKTLGQSRLMLAAMAAAIAGIALTPLFSGLVPLAVLIALNGLGAGFHQPLGLMLIAEHTHGAARGMAVGLRAAVNNVATAASPLVLGFVSAVVGLNWAFCVAGAAISALAWHVMRVDGRTQSRSLRQAAV